MLLTISTTHNPATDLGYLLYKNPARVQTFEVSFGEVHVLYPEATAERCTAALIMDVDPVALVRGKGRRGGSVSEYVNDRPYVASSLLSVALAQVYGSALAGTSRERPELADTAIPLEAQIEVLPCRGGESLLRRLFEPLGYIVAAKRYALDAEFEAWGDSPYYSVRLAATTRLVDLLRHLYVLVPVLDDAKHYWVDEAEVEKLLAKGADWLPDHPERELISRRYLRHQRSLARSALDRLTDEEGTEEGDPEDEAEAGDGIRLHDQRLGAVLGILKDSGATRVVDLGCGEGKLLQLLASEPSFSRIVGMDVSIRALESASRRLRLGQESDQTPRRIELIHGSLIYNDERLSGFDAATLVEILEHLDPARLKSLERVVFELARPQTVVVTTPNREYNARFPNLPSGEHRHQDHRFEWTRPEFEAWAERVAAAHSYAVRFLPIGPVDPEFGPPTQMGVFSLRAEGESE